MEARESSRKPIERIPAELVRFEKAPRVPAFGQPSHHDAVLPAAEVRRIRERLSDTKAAVHRLHRGESQVYVGSETPVQPQLPESVVVAGSLGGEGDEVEIDVLVELVDPISREEDVGQMCLNDLDAFSGIRVVRVGGRTRERFRPPLLHGRSAGLSEKGPATGQASYYYSQTRLQTEGTIRRADGTSSKVRGTSWFDHEFGSQQMAADQVGWDWFSVPLDDGTDLMLYVIRKRDGSIEPKSSGTLRLADGRRIHLKKGDFEVDVRRRWKSEKSGGEYPSEWQIRVPGHGVDLRVRPLLADQELRTRATTGVNYWEGLCEFEGKSGTRSVRGHGYVELVGYAGEFLHGI